MAVQSLSSPSFSFLYEAGAQGGVVRYTHTRMRTRKMGVETYKLYLDLSPQCEPCDVTP